MTGTGNHERDWPGTGDAYEAVPVRGTYMSCTVSWPAALSRTPPSIRYTDVCVECGSCVSGLMIDVVEPYMSGTEGFAVLGVNASAHNTRAQGGQERGQSCGSFALLQASHSVEGWAGVC